MDTLSQSYKIYLYGWIRYWQCMLLLMTVVCTGTSDALKTKHGTAFESFAKAHWTKADVIKTQTHPNDNLTYGLFISCFARSTQIGLMYHHNPHNTESELLPRPTAKWSLAGVWKTVTLWFQVCLGLAWFVHSEGSSRQPVPILNHTHWVLLLMRRCYRWIMHGNAQRAERWGARCWRMAWVYSLQWTAEASF